MVTKQISRSLASLRLDMAKAESCNIKAPGPEGALVGTLLLPNIGEPPYDTVLILPGSGPVDRNGNIQHIVTAATYKQLPEGLAEHGIASVRIDKRGLGEKLSGR